MIKDNNQKNLIVLVQYKALPLKRGEVIAGLTELIENVKLEPHFVNIKLHVDSKDESKILLYEEWSDETYYNTTHMTTPHLQKFIGDSRTFLAGPPEISQWKIEKEFKSK
jgi:quinol monooxygenase YgiN